MKIQVAILRAEKIKSTSGVSRVVCRDRAVICFLINEFNANKVTKTPALYPQAKFSPSRDQHSGALVQCRAALQIFVYML